MVRRSRMQIYYDILRVIQRERTAKPTHILYKANLSYEKFRELLQMLINQGFVEQITHKGKILYKLTEKGDRFLSEFAKVREFSEAFGLPI